MIPSPASIVVSTHKDRNCTYTCLRADGEWVNTDPCSFLNCVDIFKISFMYVEIFGTLKFIRYGVIPACIH